MVDVEKLAHLGEVEDVEVDPNMSLKELIERYGRIHGFMAGHLYRAVSVLRNCLDADLRVISFTANIVATGLRGILAQLIRRRIFNLVVTTAGTLDHDIARSFGGKYYKGFFEADDASLYEKGVHRLGNVFIPFESYGKIVERVVHKVLEDIASNNGEEAVGVYELVWEIGKRINDEKSILKAAYDNKTPIIVPGFVDGAFGTAIFTYLQVKKKPRIDIFKDEALLADRFFPAKKAMALIIGGGISKHHSIWWAQFRGGYDCAVYVTTAVEYDGSLSGAQPREAISWGKIKPEARHVTVYGDATLVLPIIAAGIL